MLALLALAAMPTELDAYLKTPDPAYRYAVAGTENGNITLDLTSGTWQGTEWRHKILFRQPKALAAKGTGILYITGDGPTAGDLLTLGLVAEGTGMPVAMLFKIPNQPLFDGLREDDLIAHTFQQYLETGDPSWPLLFPMTRAALRAMDAVQDETKNSDNPIKRFVVCGASKRGWTTWMVGASGDRRVVGIAPMVYENLNLSAQMPHQLATWGAYSPQIQDYTKRGLQAALATPRGQKLGAMIDPYSYRDRLTMPALLIRGSNDPYWTVDAQDQYEKGLKMRHWTLDVPNAGHDLKGGLMAAESIGAFARSLAGGPKLPEVEWSFTPQYFRGRVKGSPTPDGSGRWTTFEFHSDQPYRELKVWLATSDTLDFRPSEYTVVARADASELEKGAVLARVPLPEGRNAAVFAEARYASGGREYSLSSPTRVFAK